MRERQGKVFERRRWEEENRERKKGETAQVYARLSYTDIDSGERKIEKRSFDTKTEARDWLRDRLQELKENGARFLQNSENTFEDLANKYGETYLKPAEYVHGRKVAGLRGYRTQQTFLATLRKHFSKRPLRAITPAALEAFKARRLQAPKPARKKGAPPRGQRAIASVNRELALLRRMLNYAVEENWLTRSPFKKGLISPADEHKRERILTREEEIRLLAQCTERRAHLWPVIVCALDTGMRKGEILKLQWSDIDFDSSVITVRAFNTKTMRERRVAMTERLKTALGALFEASSKDDNERCFGIADNVKRSFRGACDAAKVPGLRFHDLRHTAATRLVRAHIPLSEVGRILGHTQPATTYRYVSSDAETMERAAAALNAFNEAGVATVNERVN